MTLHLRCPTCRQPSQWYVDESKAAVNPSRPFCSVRCKEIDLGAWASESYAIPAHPHVEDGEV
jgi:endogenous inhibitor of DNA gyrase (YacG/DUF329 family)